MEKTVDPNIIAAIERLTKEELDRLRLKLWGRFGVYLRNIPDAPDPDDLLHEAIQDVLAGVRHVPLEKVDVLNGLFKIVSSKVSHLYEAWKKSGIINVPVEMLDQEMPQYQPEDNLEEELRHDILELIQDDPVLTQVVSYRLDHAEEEPLRAGTIAAALGIGMQEMYNVNRRLKARLEKLVERIAPPNWAVQRSENVYV